MQSPDTQVILRYGQGRTWLSGEPAAIRRRCGSGTITYLGALLDPALMSVFVKRALDAAHVASVFGPLPPDVELMRRVGGGRHIFVLINHGAQERSVDLPAGMQDLLGDNRPLRKITLASQGVAVLGQTHAR